MNAYIGRFAPSPSGALHAGSLIAAVASYLDAKAHHGQWLLRIEDVDETRTVPSADSAILHLLAQLGMQWDGEVVWQSQRKALYETEYARLAGHTYACACSRREIADSNTGIAQDGAPLYAGTCRAGLPSGRVGRSLRLRVPEGAAAIIQFTDRWQGSQQQNLQTQVGDFVLKRVEGFWAYQMAVVVDDAMQGVTDVVRGVDLIDSTARQIYLQSLLGYRQPRYMHFPVLANEAGEKLSKQTGAQAVAVGESEQAKVRALQQAAAFLSLDCLAATSVAQFWQMATVQWAARWGC
ncbi:MAG: tRNA glutamyl-Q(34) synthetase GluQRS [Burkholderiales bacterium]|nr:tRNA glutamyl-Q(34) synthetase GluQRS [Burkholderiales bacterium]